MIPSLRLQVALALAGLLLIAAVLLRTTSGGVTLVPAPGGTYVEGLVGSPTFINPLLASSQADRDATALVFSGLTQRTVSGDLAPDLATAWESSPDGLAYTFHLRPQLRWSDGEPLTTDDVLFTIGLIQNPAFRGDPDLAPLWTAVQVEKIDRATIRFHLREPYAPFIQFTTLGLLPAHLWRDTPVDQLAGSELNVTPVGAGRWRLLGSPTGAVPLDLAAPSPTPTFTGPGLLLEPNPYYPSAPLLSRLWLRSYPTAAALLAALDHGEIDGASAVDPGRVAALQADKRLRVYSGPLQATEIIFLNLQLPQFDRAETRQALLWGLDRRGLLRSAASGQGWVADSPILPGSWAYTSDVAQYQYDVARARQLLEAAGWTLSSQGRRERAGTPFRFTLLIADDDPVAAALAAGAAGAWQALGLDVGVQALPRPELLETRIVTRHFAAVLLGARGLPYDPDQYQLWHSTRAQGGNLANIAGLVNTRIDQDLERARTAPDPAARTRLYADFQRTFAETVPSLLLYHPLYNYVVSARSGGIQLPASLSDPSNRFVNVSTWSVQTRPAPPK